MQLYRMNLALKCFLRIPGRRLFSARFWGLKTISGKRVNWDGSWLAMPLHLLKHEKFAPDKRRDWIFGIGVPDVFFMGFCHGRPNREPEPLGSDPESSRRRLVDGCLPGVVTRYHSFAQGLIYEQTIFAAPL